jgi:hypothetical protein
LKEERQVSFRDGIEFAKRCKCPFYEVSSKSKVNVEEPFFSLIGEIVHKVKGPFTVARTNHPNSYFFCNVL